MYFPGLVLGQCRYIRDRYNVKWKNQKTFLPINADCIFQQYIFLILKVGFSAFTQRRVLLGACVKTSAKPNIRQIMKRSQRQCGEDAKSYLLGNKLQVRFRTQLDIKIIAKDTFGQGMTYHANYRKTDIKAGQSLTLNQALRSRAR